MILFTHARYISILEHRTINEDKIRGDTRMKPEIDLAKTAWLQATMLLVPITPTIKTLVSRCKGFIRSLKGRTQRAFQVLNIMKYICSLM